MREVEQDVASEQQQLVEDQIIGVQEEVKIEPLHTEEDNIVGVTEEDDGEDPVDFNKLVAFEDQINDELSKLGTYMAQLKQMDADGEDEQRDGDTSLCLDVSSIKKGSELRTRRDGDDECEDELAMFEAGASDDEKVIAIGDGLQLGAQAFDVFKGDDQKRASAESAGATSTPPAKKKGGVNIFGSRRSSRQPAAVGSNRGGGAVKSKKLSAAEVDPERLK